MHAEGKDNVFVTSSEDRRPQIQVLNDRKTRIQTFESANLEDVARATLAGETPKISSDTYRATPAPREARA